MPACAHAQTIGQLLPRCSGVGPCREDDASWRGFVLFRESQTVCTSSILLPGFNLLPRWLLGTIYLLFLIYLFAGVAIASDLFMDGIMQITSIMKTVKRKNEKGEVVEVQEPVWNWVGGALHR